MVHLLLPDKGFADGVIGLEWGDEAKAKFTEMLAHYYDYVVRFNGGDNAGHSVRGADGMDIDFNQVPAGVTYPNKKLYIGGGSVVNIITLLEEIERLERGGLQVRNRLQISGVASLIQPFQVLLDRACMKDAVGTTGKGIGGAYGGRAYRVDNKGRRIDVRMVELLTNKEEAMAIIRTNLEVMLERLRAGEFMDDKERIEKLVAEFAVPLQMGKLERAIEALGRNIDPDVLTLCKAIKNGAKVLLEGAQACGIDGMYGPTPFVTSSIVGTGGAITSTGIGYRKIRKMWGVGKLIPSKVGKGPFVGEWGGSRSDAHCMAEGGAKFTADVERALYGNQLADMMGSKDELDVGIAMRIRMGEYGVVSKRPRRLGRTNVAHLQQAVALNDIDGVFFSKLDVLNMMKQTRDGVIQVVTGYEVDGERIDYVPTDAATLYKAKPLIEVFPAWDTDLTAARSAEAIPEEALNYLWELGERIGAPVLGVGVGPKRDQFVQLKSNF